MISGSLCGMGREVEERKHWKKGSSCALLEDSGACDLFVLLSLCMCVLALWPPTMCQPRSNKVDS